MFAQPFNVTTWADFLEISAGGGQTATVTGSGFYYEMMLAAAEMLADFVTGTVIIQQETTAPATSDSPYAPDTITRTSVEVNAVVLGYSSERIDGVQIQSGDVRVIMDSSLITWRPKKADTLKIDGLYYTLVEVKPVPAAGLCSVYILQARTSNGKAG